jgi:hypothetical protein
VQPMDSLYKFEDTTRFEVDLNWLPSFYPKGNSDHFIENYEAWKNPVELEMIDRSEQYWPFWVLLILLSLFALIRISYNNKFKNLSSAFVNSRYMKQMLREELVLTHPFSLFLTIQYAVTTGFLLYSWMMVRSFHFLPVDGWRLFLFISGAILLFMVVKTILTVLIQFLIGADGGQTENRYNFLLFSQLSGVILLPFAVLTQYGPAALLEPAIYGGAFIVAGVYVYRLFRSFSVGLSSGSTAFHLFLYLCTLEIIPLIVLIRVLVTEIG